VHSGWRGTQKRILEKTLFSMSEKYSSRGENLYVYLGPSISQANYQVGQEVADLFEDKYINIIDDKFYLDVTLANYDMLLNFGIPKTQIQKSLICTYEMKELFHSYRRDGSKSGRTLGVIALV
jgi:YfiH family protein